MGERETHDIEGCQGRCGFEREQRYAALAHERDHIDPRQIGALARDALEAIDLVVEDGDAQIGLADLIDIRIDHAYVERATLILADTPFVIDVACGPLDERKQGLDEMEAVFPLDAHGLTLAFENA